MKAQVGDHLVILSHATHHPVRDGEILEVRGPDGQPPYVVRWSDTQHDTIVYPGSDARVQPSKPPPPPAGTPVGVLGRRTLTAAGEPTLAPEEVVALVRAHIDLERLRTTDYDAELWSLWQEEAGRAEPEAHNADVLDRVLARVRVGE